MLYLLNRSSHYNPLWSDIEEGKEGSLFGFLGAFLKAGWRLVYKMAQYYLFLCRLGVLPYILKPTVKVPHEKSGCSGIPQLRITYGDGRQFLRPPHPSCPLPGSQTAQEQEKGAIKTPLAVAPPHRTRLLRQRIFRFRLRHSRKTLRIYCFQEEDLQLPVRFTRKLRAVVQKG